MKIRFVGLLVAGILAAPLSAQMPDGYLDVFIAKVKTGKRAEFDSINKRMVEINRKNKGDTWVAYGLVYGDTSTVYFTSIRPGYGSIDEGMKAFEGAAAKSLGAAGMHKLFADFDATLESSRGEVRRRRWDLSSNVPADLAAYNNLIGKARFLRTVITRVRPGRIPDYEALMKENRSAQERANPGVPTLVSQVMAGQSTGVYYLATPLTSLGDLDRIKTLQQVLGSSYATYQKSIADVVLGTEIVIGRFLPELSNPPEDIAAVDAKFWRPAPPAPPPAKVTEAKR
jgi:hypothetical protein